MLYSRDQWGAIRRELGIDSGFWPEPKAELVEAARRRIAPILFGCDSLSELPALPSACSVRSFNAREVIFEASSQGHTFLAVQWAIYKLIEAGGLVAEIVQRPPDARSHSRMWVHATTQDAERFDDFDGAELIIRPRALENAGSLLDLLDPTTLAIAPTPALYEAFLGELSPPLREPVSHANEESLGELGPSLREPVSHANLRRAYDRDHAWLCWWDQLGETYRSPAKIRDKWNALREIERKRIAPRCFEKIDEGNRGRQVVERALKVARRERKQEELAAK